MKVYVRCAHIKGCISIKYLLFINKHSLGIYFLKRMFPLCKPLRLRHSFIMMTYTLDLRYFHTKNSIVLKSRLRGGHFMWPLLEINLLGEISGVRDVLNVRMANDYSCTHRSPYSHFMRTKGPLMLEFQILSAPCNGNYVYLHARWGEKNSDPKNKMLNVEKRCVIWLTNWSPRLESWSCNSSITCIL